MSDLADALIYGYTAQSNAGTGILTIADVQRAIAQMHVQRLDYQAMQPWKPVILGNKSNLMIFDEYQGDKQYMDANCETPKQTVKPFTHALNRAKPEIAVIEQLAREAGRAEVRLEQLREVQSKLYEIEHNFRVEKEKHGLTLLQLDREQKFSRDLASRATRAENKLFDIAEKKRRATRAAKKAVALKKPVTKKK